MPGSGVWEDGRRRSAGGSRRGGGVRSPQSWGCWGLAPSAAAGKGWSSGLSGNMLRQASMSARAWGSQMTTKPFLLRSCPAALPMRQSRFPYCTLLR